jgi:APA family basic amino acid/polyamine antiporter
MILRIKDPDRPRSFRVPGGPYLLPLLGVVSCIGLAIYLPPSSWWRFVKWFLVGIVFYAVYGYHHSGLRNRRGGPPGSGNVTHDFNPEQQLPEKDVV